MPTHAHWTEADSLSVEAIANGEHPAVIVDPNFVWWCNLPEPETEDTSMVRSLFDRPTIPTPPAPDPAMNPGKPSRLPLTVTPSRHDRIADRAIIGALLVVAAAIVIVVLCAAGTSAR